MLISTNVKRVIEKIAEHGIGYMGGKKKWLGFDDADVKWFLQRYEKKQGPGIEWLRAEYESMKEFYRDETNRDRGAIFFHFIVGKRRAKEIIEDIGRAT